MKIAHPKINTVIEFESAEIVSVVIENKLFFEELLIDLSNQIDKKEETWIFSVDDKICSSNKFFDFISTPLDLRYSDRNIQKMLMNTIATDISANENILKIVELYAEISKVFNDLKWQSEYNIEFKNELSVTEILKSFDLNLEVPQGRFTERFIEYATNLHRLLGKEIFVIANCDAFIENEDYQHIKKWAEYEQVAVIFIRNEQLDLPILQNEYIIDREFCEIH